MELTTLISPDEATERLAAYEAQLTSERTAEDDAIRAGYRAAARGLPVIHLPNTIAAGGSFSNGLPRLAVVRADASECFVAVGGPWAHTDRITYADRSDDRGRAAVGAYRVQVHVPAPATVTNRQWRGRTVVPSIPPNVRPRRHRLHLFHILWEVEQWDPTPPVDPALLRHLRGDLWTVHATWDLTELERAVLAARAS
jgi:hypothetical protein